MTDTGLLEHGDISQSAGYIRTLCIPPNANLLDIGTRYGSLLNALSKDGYTNVQGIDVSAECIESGRLTYPELKDRLRIYEGEALPFEAESFDVVTMFDVIEHIPNIAGFMREVCRVLKEGGRFVFQTPNRHINIPWEILQSRSLTQWRTYHCSLQTASSLKRLLEIAGFGTIAVEKLEDISDFKLTQVRKALGLPGVWAVQLLARMPVSLTPNLWGHCRKDVQNA